VFLWGDQRGNYLERKQTRKTFSGLYLLVFISIAATTNSRLIIRRCPIDFLELELFKLEKMGFKYKILRHYKAKKQKNIIS